ncbi:MAG: hypothetical protein A2008_01480 [Candidatus Wallbacteria bacterium GWC2_49_35]|uniref:Uncharacterized protein n=1 Tax=Candidatus Wallbacteria bacterium GWC2_49_35 TaxID=1817813 RepID=A0A1F7WZL6_9BACT|nr:MAG: hypothetical protein A2008_01480 [Candidatus Wallbacteria bacterium GWC2_49_35]HBC74171.1 hypothetical protein [Candidatus Wallbacteria bacterium]
MLKRPGFYSTKFYYAYAVISLLLFVIAASSAQAADISYTDVKSLCEKRMGNANLKRAVLGLLVYFDDTQVRNRPGTKSSVFDASDAGEGCDGKVELNVPLLNKALSLPAIPPIKVRNVEGEWWSTVHFLPKKIGFKGKSMIAIPDSNLFVPAFVVYPLFLLRENLPAADRHIAKMLKHAWNINERYKRGDAYNFWLKPSGQTVYTAPYNIPIEKAVLPLAKAYINPKLAFFWKGFAKGLNVPPSDWVIRCLDENENQSGASALFNIPNDSDDSSTALAIQQIRGQLKGAYSDDAFFLVPGNFAVDNGVMDVILKYRDTARDPKFEDGRDAWKGVESGAYLTWLRDEKEPTFSEPERGIIPLGKNNVDIVVNSNVLLMLGLTGNKRAPGYNEAVSLLTKAVFKKVWPAAGLYYPQYMIFPYTVTRAYRDGGNDALRPAMKKLVHDLIDEQRMYSKTGNDKVGAFPGGEDKTDYLSTALGLISLLNIGADIAYEEGLLNDYNFAVESAVAYLLNTAKKYRVKNPETFGAGEKDRDLYGVRWDSGLFFSASFWDLAHWRSEPFAQAMILEAFVKYMLAYDAGGTTIMSGRRLHIKQYPHETGDVENFILEVK